MGLFELILLLLICIAASSVLDQVISRMSLPLIQIAIGVVAAFLLPPLANVHLDAELFLVLFIAPLLFNESIKVSKSTLWRNRWSVLSMAIVLVIVTVLVAGEVLHGIIPIISLAACFACAGALGPTDAAAVAALGSTIKMTTRQSILLSGEALINDASGVVAFQFAIAAALTGEFHASKALGSFSILFFGGILAGIIMGWLLRTGMRWLKERGYISTTLYVIYEVLSPFMIYLASEELHVSGILAVVAAGIMMQDENEKFISPEHARNKMVANSFWEVLIFVINGMLFVMLGMQLPKVLDPVAISGLSVGRVLCGTLALVAAIEMIRFIWILCLELYHRDEETGARGIENVKATMKESLITTVAGPKGAVTLSIILTLPYTLSDGSPFPNRDLIIFVTSGAILCTLLIADILLPVLAASGDDDDYEKQLFEARELVLSGVIKDLQRVIEDNKDEEFAPALALTAMGYRARLMQLRFSADAHASVMTELAHDTLEVQQARAKEIQEGADDIQVEEGKAYFTVLQAFENIGSGDLRKRAKENRDRVRKKMRGLSKKEIDNEKVSKAFKDACTAAIDLEKTAISYLKGVRTQCDDTDACSIEDKLKADVADVLIEEHEAALRSIEARAEKEAAPDGKGRENLSLIKKHALEADANGLEMELDQIRRLRMEGKISGRAAKELREEVYLLQTSLIESE